MFKFFFRQFKRQPVTSAILLGGLILSLAAALLIAAFVSGEFSYDRFHKNANRIVLLTQFENNSTASGGQLGADLQLRYPQVESFTRMRKENVLVAYENTAAYEPEFYFADPASLSIFTFSWVEGNAASSLLQANGLVITQSMALKYFGNQSPLGKTMKINEKFNFIVEGVVEDFPANSHIRPGLLANYKSANEVIGYDVSNNYWGLGANTYLLLKNPDLLASLKANLPDYVKSLNDPNALSVWKLNLVPLKDLYLRTSLIGTSPISYVYIFSAAGILILLLAAFNFINLTTAKATTRYKEVGMRKLMGSSQIALRKMFLGEAAIMVTLSVVIAIVLVSLVIPTLGNVSGWQPSLWLLLQPHYLLIACLVLVLFILISGIYPAWMLSAGKPILLIQGKRENGAGKIQLRRFLVVFQFAVSAIMLVVTLCVYKQLDFIQHKNLGYNREQVITLELRDSDAQTKERFKQRILQLPQVQAASIAFALPGSNMYQGQKLIKELVPTGSDDASIIRLTIDKGYAETFGIKLITGRLLDENLPADKPKFLINKAALSHFGWKDIQGKMVGYYTYMYNPDGSYEEVPLTGEVVGVMDDYHHNDLKTAIKPTIFSLNGGMEDKMGIRLSKGSVTASLEAINKVWHEVFPNKPFEFAFMDDTFNSTYAAEQRTGKVFAGFALIAVFISCLGLFGLVYFSLQRRQKEISIRKVLGASVASVAGLVSKEFLLLAVIAASVGLPLAWFGVQRWLQQYAYRFTFEWWLLLIPAILLFVLIIFTISGLVARIAFAKPVQFLRNE